MSKKNKQKKSRNYVNNNKYSFKLIKKLAIFSLFALIILLLVLIICFKLL